ncbi:MAG: hypothetical protein AAFQ61_03165 [Cyanobacteria bacterium J06626_23]
MPPTYFYIPECYWPSELPTHSGENWSGFGLGLYAWTIQTYLRLQEAGLPCKLTRQLPQRGIVLFHSNALRAGTLQPGSKRLLICLKAEGPVCPIAQLHVVQNPREARPLLGANFMPHWPQPGLLPRDPQRGDRLETVAFLGHESSLDPVFRTTDWAQQLAERGMRWVAVSNTNGWDDARSVDTCWNDYRQIDAVVALRRVHARRPGYFHKPATKLYNAWLAGVPAILGKETAYRRVGRAGVNYLEANSPDEVLAALDWLKRSAELKHLLLAAGQAQSVAYRPAALTQRWLRFLRQVAVPAYDRWCRLNGAQRQVCLLGSGMMNMCDRAVRRLVNAP